MINLRYFLLPVFVLLLPACSTKPVLISTLPAAAVTPRPSFVGISIPALPPGSAGAAVALQKSDLEQRLQNDATRMQIALLPDDALILRSGSAHSFEAASAQMKLAALTSYAAIAEVLKTFPSSVLHIVVHEDAPQTESVATSLGARRAASILDYLERNGVAPTRLRAEGRSKTGARDQVELVLKPVIQNREGLAWTPPS